MNFFGMKFQVRGQKNSEWISTIFKWNCFWWPRELWGVLIFWTTLHDSLRCGYCWQGILYVQVFSSINRICWLFGWSPPTVWDIHIWRLYKDANKKTRRGRSGFLMVQDLLRLNERLFCWGLGPWILWNFEVIQKSFFAIVGEEYLGCRKADCCNNTGWGDLG